MVVSSSTPARLQSEPIKYTISIILLISHRNQKKRAKTWGETPRQMGYSSSFRCEIKSIIDKVDFIGSDCSRAGVDEETTIVCLQRRRTGGATAVRGLDDDGRGG